MNNLKIAYIGGGSKEWATSLMGDLALTPTFCGEVALYDIDEQAAQRNCKIGTMLAQNPNCVSKWRYGVSKSLKDCLTGADFVICSILPATFDEMEYDVHLPEKYGIYQPVGDTVGPGGVLRAMRTVPIYEQFAREIEHYCPNAFVVNLTNPMTICTKTLHDVFPAVKAFGCCHEVFHAQDFLACVAEQILKIERPSRSEIYTDACGINHFTWITQASYKHYDLLKLIPQFAQEFFEDGYCERQNTHPSDFKNDLMRYGNKVKMDMYLRYGALGAAGDRHLVEFMQSTDYLSDRDTLKKWAFHLTPVSFRKERQARRVELSKQYASGTLPFPLKRSSEELCDIIEGLLGLKKVVTNVNYPNLGQMQDMPKGAIVETNCEFYGNSIKPIISNPLPPIVNSLVARNLYNIEATYQGIKNRNLNQIFQAFQNQPLCCCLSQAQAQELFAKMVEGTKRYLAPYFAL